MSEHDDARRAFLAGGVGAAAGAAISTDAAAQSVMTINDPAVVREIETEFAGYDRALGANDVAALNGYFFESPFTIRYGIAENLYGYPEIQAYRAAVVASGAGPKRERTVITAYGKDFATVEVLEGESLPESPALGSNALETVLEDGVVLRDQTLAEVRAIATGYDTYAQLQ